MHHPHDPTLFRGRYRIPSTRLPGWDYAHMGHYFITICTKYRVPHFGVMQNGIMHASPIGRIVEQYWSNIPTHFPHVQLDAFVVMPDHMHGIIVMGQQLLKRVRTDYKIPRPPPGSLGSVLNQFKSACTKQIRSLGCIDFEWQPRYHDSLIRSTEALEKIRQYIRENPLHWKK